MAIGGVECFGNETEILKCSYLTASHETVSACDPNEVAGVVCLGMTLNIHVREVDHFPTFFFIIPQIPSLNLLIVEQEKSDWQTLLIVQKRILGRELFRSVSIMPGALCVVMTSLTTLTLQYFVAS